MATIKEELLVLGIRQAVVTCRRGTSVARSLKLLALPYSNNKHINQHYCNPTRVVVIGELPYMTNRNV